MARPKSIKYRTVTVKKFWEMVVLGYKAPWYCFLIMEDGSQDWGYPLTKWQTFDHHRQGAVHRQNVAYVLLPAEDLKAF